jgi:hypothetical protein
LIIFISISECKKKKLLKENKMNSKKHKFKMNLFKNKKNLIYELFKGQKLEAQYDEIFRLFDYFILFFSYLHKKNMLCRVKINAEKIIN